MKKSRTNPFPGLRPFQVEDEEFFFGREREVLKVAKSLQEHSAITVLGPEECGKTSFVLAGLVPRLDRFLSKYRPTWPRSFHPIYVCPGVYPIKRLAEGILRSYPRPHQYSPEELEGRIRSGSFSLGELMRNEELAPVLIVDQIEDVLNSPEDQDAHRFLDLVVEVYSRSGEQCKLVLISRPQGFGDLVQIPGLVEVATANVHVLREMEPGDLSYAIGAPIHRSGGHIDPELVERIMLEMSDHFSHQLPLMQHTLKSCWDRAMQDAGQDGEVRLSRQHYAEVGGISNSIDNSGDIIFGSFDQTQKQVCEVLFRALTDRDSRGYFVRRLAKANDVALIAQSSSAEVLKVANAFLPTNFLQVLLESDEATVAMNDAVTPRSWRRMARWMDEEQKMSRQYRDYAYRAQLAEAGAGSWLSEDELPAAVELRKNPTVTPHWAARYGGRLESVDKFLSKSLNMPIRPTVNVQRRKIFICYRREDSAHPAHRISEGLGDRFSRERVFLDEKSITPGSNFEVYIARVINECAVMLVLIGDHWADARHQDGPRQGELRLADPEDFVRREIEMAFRSGLLVIPVLVGRRLMPAPEELPNGLRALANCQAVKLPASSTEDFSERIDFLAKQIQAVMPSKKIFKEAYSWIGLLASRRG